MADKRAIRSVNETVGRAGYEDGHHGRGLRESIAVFEAMFPEISPLDLWLVYIESYVEGADASF